MTDIRCKQCGRFLGAFEQSQLTITLKCPNCKALTRYHFVRLSDYVPQTSMIINRTKAHLKDVPKPHTRTEDGK